MPSRPFQSILYVDDDPDICEVVRASLCLIAGLGVHTAGSGEEAIDLSYELRPDLILMDVMMPGLDGPATFERMRNCELIDKIPIVFLTAKVLPEEIAHFLGLGAIGVIGKPFDPLKLGKQLLTLWGDRESPRDLAASHAAEPHPQAKVTSLTKSFLERTRGDAVRLIDLLPCVQGGDKAALKEFERIAHSIHGAGAMFGFPQLSAAGGAIEEVAGEVLASPSSSTSSLPPSMRRLLHCTQLLAHEVERITEAAGNDSVVHHWRAAGR